MSAWLGTILGLVCAQAPEHTWAPGGWLLPCCQRCTGLYVGAAVALVLHLALRLRSRGWFLPVHGLFLLAMIPLGLHWLPQNDIVRGVSGFLFGAGLVSFLWLHPGPRVVAVEPLTAAGASLYAAIAGVGTVLVPVLGRYGGVVAARGLAWLALAGLTGLALLALANVALAVRWQTRQIVTICHAGSASGSSPRGRRV
jgi:uncharacterized membrane protein